MRAGDFTDKVMIRVFLVDTLSRGEEIKNIHFAGYIGVPAELLRHVTQSYQAPLHEEMLKNRWDVVCVFAIPDSIIPTDTRYGERCSLSFLELLS